MKTSRSRLAARSAIALVLLGGCGSPDDGAATSRSEGASPESALGRSTAYSVGAADSVLPSGLNDLIPLPVSVTSTGGTFTLGSTATICVDPPTPEMMAIGDYLAAKLRPATGYSMAVVPADDPRTCRGSGDLVLTTTGGDPALEGEGYELAIAADRVQLSAARPAGIFHGVQTLRQLLPPAIENAAVSGGPWEVATGTIHDHPRFAWRGAMLDVARHFFGVGDVERYIDLLSYYKMNVLHLHLSDDQGWRIAIRAWPNLATYGGSTAVGGGPGGYYTQADYSAIVAYAKERYVTLVPEIDMPGHTTAALASNPDLNCDGVSPPLDTDKRVGISSLCVSSDTTYGFVEDVIGEIAALTPGSYFHIGGDEAQKTSVEDFQRFFARVEPLIQAAGKKMIGWDAVGRLASLPPGSIVQYWSRPDAPFVLDAVAKNAMVLMSPANVAYLDMKYDPTTPLGTKWAGYVDERTAYAWDPAAVLSGVADAQLVGIEAPLWSETLVTLADVESLAFPRIVGHAEIGWSPREGRTWDEYRLRLGAQGPRLRALGVNFHVSASIPWQ
jgi:hexosaminidase